MAARTAAARWRSWLRYGGARGPGNPAGAIVLDKCDQFFVTRGDSWRQLHRTASRQSAGDRRTGQVPDDLGMGKCLPAILPRTDGGGCRLLYDRYDKHLIFAGGADGIIPVHLALRRPYPAQLQWHSPRLAQPLPDRPSQAGLVRTDTFILSIDDGLGRIDRFEVQPSSVSVLPPGILVPAKDILPAQPVPIVYMENKEKNGVLPVFLLQAGQQAVRGRTARASLGSKKFDDGESPRRRRQGRSRCKTRQLRRAGTQKGLGACDDGGNSDKQEQLR